jgi:hypothetical protein
MNKPADKYHDAEDARNVAILRERMTAEVEGLRESLAVWIEENTPHPIDAAVSIAMLETAFDRYIDLPRRTPLNWSKPAFGEGQKSFASRCNESRPLKSPSCHPHETVICCVTSAEWRGSTPGAPGEKFSEPDIF